MVNRLARFIAVSALGLALNLAITITVHEVLGGSEETAFAVAIVTVFVLNFLACRYFIFDAARGDPRRQFLGFLMSSGLFRVLQYAGFLLVHTVLHVQYLVAAILVLGFTFFAKFSFYGNVVFTGGEKDSA